MPRPGPDRSPPPAMTVAELEAAVAALPGKRDALREAFDRLAAYSPSPLPFSWEDLDGHLSSLQSSISLRFRQLRALEALRPAPAAAAPGKTRGEGTGVNLADEEVVEVTEVVEEEEEVAEVEESLFLFLERGVELEQEEELVEMEERVVEQEEDEKADEEMQEGNGDETDDKIGKDGKDEKEAIDEVLQEEEIEEAAHDKVGNAIKDENDAREEEQDADEEIQVANEEQSTEDGKKASQDKEDASMEAEQSTEDGKKASEDKDEANMEAEQSTGNAKKASLDKEEDANMEEAATKKASALQGKKQEACGEKQVEEEKQEAHEEEQDAKNTTKEEEKAKKVSHDQGSQVCPVPVVSNDLAAAFTTMDARRLVKLIHTNVGLSSEFHAAMHRAPDGAALSLHVIKLFLRDKTLKTNKVWNNCVGLIQTVPEVATKLSTGSIEQAKQLARDWKELIDNPRSCTALGSLASWGLLNFLISYNIVSEFDTKEIFHIFGTIPFKQQRKNHYVLFKGLGLNDRIPELMDYLIGNGKQLNALYLAPVFNLVDKYPPLSLLKAYVEKAKQTIMEISQKNMRHQSLRAVVIKEIDSLKVALNLAKQHISDSGLRTGIMAELYALRGEFEKKKWSLADGSTASSSNPQQQQIESRKKRKKEQQQEHHMGQETQQQGQQSKLGKTLEKKQNRPQQKQEDKPQEKQQQNKHQRSKRPRQRTPKLPPRAAAAVREAALRGHLGHPPYATMHGFHQGYPAQLGWPGVHCAPAPPAAQLGVGAPEYIGPFNPFYHRPEFYPR